MTSSGDRFDDLIEQIARLRDPKGGCPWDRAQDHVSLRPYMLEEAYEAIGAIDSGRPDALCDELGDVLLQVVLHARIAEENGEFSIRDVVDGLIAKLVRRHPHVFGDASHALPDILQRWNEIKAEEGAHKSQMPPLVEARKLIHERKIQGTESFDMQAEDGETAAGMRILQAVGDCWNHGHEPELALRKAVAFVRSGEAEADA
jgi:uncharacterized protein YabN with tetrapyrrole methylase and pyrophosphatase domain